MRWTHFSPLLVHAIINLKGMEMVRQYLNFPENSTWPNTLHTSWGANFCSPRKVLCLLRSYEQSQAVLLCIPMLSQQTFPQIYIIDFFSHRGLFLAYAQSIRKTVRIFFIFRKNIGCHQNTNWMSSKHIKLEYKTQNSTSN